MFKKKIFRVFPRINYSPLDATVTTSLAFFTLLTLTNYYRVKSLEFVQIFSDLLAAVFSINIYNTA